MRVKKRCIALIVGLGCVGLAYAGYRAFQRAWTWGNAEAIHIAAYEGDIASLDALIAGGAELEPRASVYARQWFDVTPLHAAAERDAVGSIDTLLAAGAGVDTPDGLGRSPLWAAVWRCSEGAAEALLAAGANPQGVAGEDEWAGDTTPLQLALRRCSIDLVAEVLAHGTALELAGEAALAWIDGPDRLAKLELLLPLGFDVNATDYRADRTALAAAAAHGDLDAVRLLLDHGADIDLASGHYELTPVFWAAYSGQSEVMVELLERGANPHTGTEAFGSLIYVASFNGHAQTVREILRRDLPIPLHLGRASDGATPLHMAYSNGNSELIELLLEAGADPEIQTSGGSRPREFGK